MRQIPSFRAFSREEIDFVKSFKTGDLRIEAGTPIFMEGHDSPHIYTVLDGWAIRYKLLESGRRQIYNFSLRGDFLGLQSVLFDRMLHSVEALTDVHLCVFSRSRVLELYEKHAGLAYDVTWMAAREESILAEHLATVGQRPALERLAYILLYLFDRARRSALINGNVLRVPIRQEHLADAMGLSLVHTNKTLQRLRTGGLIEWTRDTIRLRDERRLAELAGGLEPDGRPRPFI